MKRIVIIITGILMYFILFCSPYVYAGLQSSDRIMYKSANLYRNSGNLTVSFSITANSNMINIGASSIVIQYNDSGFGWLTEYTFTPENTTSLQIHDEDSYTSHVTYTPVYENKTYRAIVYLLAENSSGISTATATTNSV